MYLYHPIWFKPGNSHHNLCLGHIDGLERNCSNSIVHALELLQSCTKPSICSFLIKSVWNFQLFWYVPYKCIGSRPRQMFALQFRLPYADASHRVLYAPLTVYAFITVRDISYWLHHRSTFQSMRLAFLFIVDCLVMGVMSMDEPCQ